MIHRAAIDVGLAPQAWEALGAYLRRDSAALLDPQTRSAFARQWQDIFDQEAHLEDALLIGLVGGTGVGKSTLINALASREVSRSSDRRPTTSRVVVYRYVQTELPDELPTRHLSQPQVLHQHQALAKVILFDFPDFDSAERSHREILEEYLPDLDILLIVVDDIKYGDRRLYELLHGLNQDRGNLFLVFNKVDRLRNRYANAAPGVVEDLLCDLRNKLRDNAALDLSPAQTYAIAAQPVFEARLQGRSCDDEAAVRELEKLLAGYQEEKHRRAAKERNIDVRKANLAEAVAATALSDEHRKIIEEAESLVRGWSRELETVLAAIPAEVVTDRERSGLRRKWLQRAGHAWGFPFSLAFTLLAELGRVRERSLGHAPAEWGARIYQHYRPYFEALASLHTRFGSEFIGSQIAITQVHSQSGDAPQPLPSPESYSAQLARTFQQTIQPPDAHPRTFRRWTTHLPALAVLSLAIWSRVSPMVAAATGEGDRGLIRTVVGAILGTLNPMFLVGTLLAIVMAYLAIALFVWLRTIHSLDGLILQAEAEARTGIQTFGQKAVDALDRRIQQLRTEFDQLTRALTVSR
jgi:predicted GTPase